MKPVINHLATVHVRSFLSLLFLMAIADVSAQTTLKPSVYSKFIKPSATVKVQTVEGQRIEHTDTAKVTDVRLNLQTKNVIKYENKISAVDLATLQHFKEETKSETPTEEVKVIPELHVETGATATAEATTYRIVFTSVQPLHFNETTRSFSGRMAFLLIHESGENNKPIEPVKIEISSDEIGNIKPATLEIDHLSIPSSYVDLAASNISDSASVRISTISNPNGYTTYLKVRPTLTLYTNRTQLQGWGIQEIPLTVSFSGSRSKDSVLVSFSVEKGTVTPSTIKMAYDQTAEVHLRSEGLGTSKITATVGSVRSNDVVLNYIFPWFFILASVLGGIAGTFIKHYSKSTRKKLSGKLFLVGIVTGLIGAAAYYVLGINLLSLSLSGGMNEVAVFAISALFAYFGISITTAISKE